MLRIRYFFCRAVMACALAGGGLLPLDTARAGGFSVPYYFQGRASGDGYSPRAGLIEDPAGNLYGTTYGGGNACGRDGCGTVFKLAPDGSETILHSFLGAEGADGQGPIGSLVLDKKGNLYGTTLYGGAQICDYCGTVFEVAPDGTETILYQFQGEPYGDGDGAFPEAGLVMHGDNLYGTTFSGGRGGSCYHAQPGCGTVFEMSRQNDGTWTETVLYKFAGGAKDGANPTAELVRDKAGSLYGTTEFGGGSGCVEEVGCGTVFKIAPDGTESVLYVFTGGSDGGLPLAGLILDDAGNLYGTTSSGGTRQSGVVFELAPDGAETVLHSFAGGSDGKHPLSSLLRTGAGALYGTTAEGGTGCRACGIVFKVAPDGTETILHEFEESTDGARPTATLIIDSSGYIYGTASQGGDDVNCGRGCGTVFKLKK